MATVVNSTAITVQWDRLQRCRDANGLITMYRVRFLVQPRETLCRNIDPDVSTDVPGQYNTNGRTTVTVTPFTVYSIQVAAVNEEGDVGVYSDPVTERTPEGGEAAVCGRCICSECNVFFCPSSSRSCDYCGSSFFFQDSLHLGLS